jgi:hypothetical protein
MRFDRVIGEQWARDNPGNEWGPWLHDQISRLMPSRGDLVIADIRASRPHTARIIDLAYCRSCREASQANESSLGGQGGSILSDLCRERTRAPHAYNFFPGSGHFEVRRQAHMARGSARAAFAFKKARLPV